MFREQKSPESSKHCGNIETQLQGIKLAYPGSPDGLHSKGTRGESGTTCGGLLGANRLIARI